jgi:hypothetical protein
MADINFDIPKVTLKMFARLESAMELIGAAGVGWAHVQLKANRYSPATKIRTGNLGHSLTWSTSKKQGPLNGPATKGGKLKLAERPLFVKIGSIAAYAARVEFGFVGQDSLGRYFNQAAKSYLRAGILGQRATVLAIVQRAIKGKKETNG